MRNAVIRRATLVLPDGIRRGPLYVCDGRVSATRPTGGAFELDLPEHLIFPGLINAHDHLHLNSIPPLPHAAPFPNGYAWIAAFQAHFADPAVAAAMAVASARRHHHGALKNLLSGATSVLHHDPRHTSMDAPAFPVRVLQGFHWSHSLGMGRQPRPPAGLLAYGPPVAESFAATPARQPWIIHLGEGTDELAAGELARLEELGCLANNTVLVHGVALGPADVERIIRRGAAVIWCPGSNLSILGRTLNPRRLFDAGRLTLGTDSRLSGARDLLAELQIAAAHSDLAPRELLQLVTVHAARVLRAPAVGGLEAGQHADLLMLRDEGGDPYRQLLAAGRAALCAVVLGGAPAIAAPEFADWFAACGLEVARATLEGRARLLAVALVDTTGAGRSLPEPGLELVDRRD
jgi:cytosine/adenosine deaminase-related metal-dependent hydrolase